MTLMLSVKHWFQSLPFLVLFPGFLAYHWAVINDLTPLFLGGYVNEVSALVCAGFLFGLFCKRIRISGLTSLDMLFLIFMSWFALVTLLNFTMMTAPGVTKNHTAALVQISAAYLAARKFSLDQIQKKLLWMAVILGVWIIWVASIGQIEFMVAGNYDSRIANYQSLSRTFLITAIFGVSSIRTPITRCAGYVFAAFVLFLLGARSELVGVFIIVFVFEVFSSAHSGRKLFIIILCFALVASVIFSFFDFLQEFFPDNRALNLIQLGASDESFAARSIAQQIAWDAVQNNPLLGDYGHYEKEVSPGFYAHSWLGVWVDLGFFGLALYLSIHVYAVWCAIRMYGFEINRKIDFYRQRLALAMGLLAMIVIFNLVAKNFTDTGLAVAVGFLASLMASHQYNPGRIKNTH